MSNVQTGKVPDTPFATTPCSALCLHKANTQSQLVRSCIGLLLYSQLPQHLQFTLPTQADCCCQVKRGQHRNPVCTEQQALLHVFARPSSLLPMQGILLYRHHLRGQSKCHMTPSTPCTHSITDCLDAQDLDLKAIPPCAAS